MNKIRIIMITMSLLIITFIACNKEDINKSQNIFEKDYDPTLRLELGNAVNATFTGRIVDESLNPIQDVRITIGSKKTYTDGQGHFSILNADVNERYALITAEKDSYFKGYRNLKPLLKISNELEIMLLQQEIVGSVDSEQGGSVYVNDRDHSILFESGFVNEWNQPYTGEVTVMAKYIDPLGTYIDMLIPGSLRAVDKDNKEVRLISYGMLNVELYGEDNQRLQLADGSEAVIQIKAPENNKRAVISEIPLWYLDDHKGYWIEYGMSEYKDGYYIGKVSHFTPTNVDDPEEDLE